MKSGLSLFSVVIFITRPPASSKNNFPLSINIFFFFVFYVDEIILVSLIDAGRPLLPVVPGRGKLHEKHVISGK